MSRQRTYVVVVESDGGRKSRTVGPYHNGERAESDAHAWDGKKGRRAWVEPVHAPEAFRADPELPVSIQKGGVAMARAVAVAVLAAGLAACAGAPEVESEVHCVDTLLVPITVGQAVYFVPGRCKAWSVGPTPRQREEFDKRAAARGGL